MFRRQVRLSSFQACWRQPNVTPFQKGSPSSSVTNFRPISITSELSKVFERRVSIRLGRFMKRSGVLPTTQFAYWKGLGTRDALLCVSYPLLSALGGGRRPGSYRLISAQHLISSTIREFCTNSVLWVLKALCCLY